MELNSIRGRQLHLSVAQALFLLLAHARLVCAPSYIIAGHLLFLSCLFVLSNYPVLSSEWLLCPLANYESTILARRAVPLCGQR